MDIKYNVFISSTYDDLIEEREKIVEVLLSMDCMPRNMETFYACDMSTWERIQEILLKCDYFIIVLAGRYGSICEQTGKCFTQMEYEFAKANNIPISRFLYKCPHQLPFDKHDNDIGCQVKFEQFRSMLQEGQIVKYWSNSDELACSVAVALHHFILSSAVKEQNINQENIEIFDNLDKTEEVLRNTVSYNTIRLFHHYVSDFNKFIQYNAKSDYKFDLLINDEYRFFVCEIANILLSSGFNMLSIVLDNIKLGNSVPIFNVLKRRNYNFGEVGNNELFNILFEFQGFVSGKILLCYKESFINKIYGILSYKHSIDWSIVEEKIKCSVLQEISSIFVGCALTSFSTMLNVKTRISKVVANKNLDSINIFDCDEEVYTIKISNIKYKFDSFLILNQAAIRKMMKI